MVSVLADPALYAFTGGEPPSLPELRARYEWQAVGRSADGTRVWLNWIVRVRPGNEAIGYLQATVTGAGEAATADIAWVIGTAWQDRGYATEAARALVGWLEAIGIASITARVHPDHAASGAVAAAAGLDPTDLIEDGERVWRRP